MTITLDIMGVMQGRLNDVWATTALVVLIIVLALVVIGGFGGLAVASFLAGIYGRFWADRRSRHP